MNGVFQEIVQKISIWRQQTVYIFRTLQKQVFLSVQPGELLEGGESVRYERLFPSRSLGGFNLSDPLEPEVCTLTAKFYI